MKVMGVYLFFALQNLLVLLNIDPQRQKGESQ